MVGIAFAVSIFHYGGDSNLWLMYGFISLLIGCLVRVQPVWYGAPFYWSSIHWWVVAYLAWIVALVWLSTLPENSLIFARLMSAFGLVFLLCVNLPRDTWLRVFAAFMITGLFCACWGIAEYVVTAKRANGPMIDPSLWGALNNLLFFGTLAVFLTTTRYRWVLGIALCVFAVAVFCSYSRVATTIFAAALGFVFLLTFRYRQVRGRLITVTVTSIVAFALVHGYAGQQEASHSEGYTLDLEEKGWSQRLSMWRAGLELYADHPVTGSGLATFKAHYPRYRDADDLKNLGNFVHNDYIQYLAEGGPLLLAFLLAFTAYLVYRLYQGSMKLVSGNRDRLEPGGLESVVLIVAMGTSLAHALMNFVLYLLPTIMVTGLYFARTVKLADAGDTRQIKLTRPWAGRAGSVIIVILLAGIAFLDELSNDLVYEHRKLPFTKGLERDSVEYFDTIRWLTLLRGANSTNQFALATLYRMRFDQDAGERTRRTLGLAAAVRYEQGLELNPFRFRIRQYYAEFLKQNPWLRENEEVRAEPEDLLREGVRLGPVYAENHLALADYLVSRGREDEAYRILEQWARHWSRLQYPGHQEQRVKVFKRLLRLSRARGDTDIQRHMVQVLESG